MRIKRFAGVPLLGAVEKNKRTLVPLAKTQPQTALQRCLFPLNPVSSSSIDSRWGKSSRSRQSCQWAVAAAINTFSGCACLSEFRLWNFQVARVSGSLRGSFHHGSDFCRLWINPSSTIHDVHQHVTSITCPIFHAFWCFLIYVRGARMNYINLPKHILALACSNIRACLASTSAEWALFSGGKQLEYHNIWDNPVLPTLWQQFGEGPFRSNMDAVSWLCCGRTCNGFRQTSGSYSLCKRAVQILLYYI